MGVAFVGLSLEPVVQSVRTVLGDTISKFLLAHPHTPCLPLDATRTATESSTPLLGPACDDLTEGVSKRLKSTYESIPL